MLKYLVISFTLLFLNVLQSCDQKRKKTISITKEINFSKEGELTLRKTKSDSIFKTLDIEIAQTEYETQTGLMYRKSMEEHQAMLFIFQEEQPRSFYMKNTEFSLDIIYINKKKTAISWQELIANAMLKRVALTENSHYATPVIHFDKAKEKGHPFAYHVYGTAIFKTTVDCLRGTYEFDDVKIIHDYGKSMSKGIDLGQIEGALIQGIGWTTMEEITYNKEGRLLSNALSTYKVPDIFSIPKNIDILPLKTEGNDMAILKSKAVGEPPLMYGIGAYFAIQNAVKAFNPKHQPAFSLPFTPEKVLMALYEY